MRVLSKKITESELSGFEHIGSSSEKIRLSKDGTLKAGKTWKGRFVSFLEPLGLFKGYCERTKMEQAEENRLAAWTLWNGLVKKYGIDNAREALHGMNPELHGMDGVKVRQGLLQRSTVGNADSLTCGEVSQLIQKTKTIHRLRSQQIQQLHEHVPMTEKEAALYEPEHPHTSTVSNAIKNHQRAIDFVGNKANLLFLLAELNEEPSRLNKSRVDYITERLLYEVGATKAKGVFSREQIIRMTERILHESLKHNASWCRMQTIKLEANKRMMKPSKFVQEFAALKDSVTASAEAIITPEYVQDVGRELAMPVRRMRAKVIAAKVRRQVDQKVTNERITLGEKDFKEMTLNALRK
ncbi:hypothetical protein [Halodesulfovibrio sp.]|uniref:hypothetical protein n=1 Tax=Halodesulfovibrio sp. TaxID=1912772 RepID=UPI0025BFB0C0|nr:hypothetical protein [Halodesulfovibrio sp.]